MFQTNEYNSWYDLPMYMTNNIYPLSSGLCYVCFFSGSFYTHVLLLKLLMSVYLQEPTQVPFSLRSPCQSLGPEAVPPLSPFMQFYIAVRVKF